MIFAGITLYYYIACVCFGGIIARAKTGQNTILRRKPDMFESTTTYLWQTRSSVDARILCASTPVSLSRTQPEFGLAWVNEVSTSKQADTARPQLTLRRPVVLRSRHESANFTLNQNLSSSCVGTRFLCSDAGSAKNLFNNHADMGVSTPVSAFFISRNTSLPQVSA